MKFQLLAILGVLMTLVHCLNIPYQDMTDIEIANYAVENFEDSQGGKVLFYLHIPPCIKQLHTIDIVYPVLGDVWHVGEKVNVTFKPDNVDQTVTIFFFNKTDILAGGVLNQTSYVFNFTVPKEAYSGNNSTSLLLAVRRQNRYLQTVDSVVLQVL